MHVTWCVQNLPDVALLIGHFIKKSQNNICTRKCKQMQQHLPETAYFNWATKAKVL